MTTSTRSRCLKLPLLLVSPQPCQLNLILGATSRSSAVPSLLEPGVLSTPEELLAKQQQAI